MREHVRHFILHSRATPLAFLALSASCTPTRIRTEHYLAVFDPQQQVTQELYRVQIAGDSQALSNVEYASGWVPAADADLLTRDLRSNEQGILQVSGQGSALAIGPSRQFYEVGPLAVATAPQDGRFVVVMSSDPDLFFQKIGALSRFRQEEGDANDVERAALLSDVRKERIRALEAIDAMQGEVQ